MTSTFESAATCESLSEALPFDVEVYFDGACPLCFREIALLRRWDKLRRIRFTDISAKGFDAAALGRTQDELMGEIHGRLPGGEWITGVEVFRRLYAAVGFRWLVAMTRWPFMRPLLDVGYRWFARHRLRLTGRCNETCRIEHGAECQS